MSETEEKVRAETNRIASLIHDTVATSKSGADISEYALAELNEIFPSETNITIGKDVFTLPTLILLTQSMIVLAIDIDQKRFGVIAQAFVEGLTRNISPHDPRLREAFFQVDDKVRDPGRERSEEDFEAFRSTLSEIVLINEILGIGGSE